MGGGRVHLYGSLARTSRYSGSSRRELSILSARGLVDSSEVSALVALGAPNILDSTGGKFFSRSGERALGALFDSGE